MGSSVSEGLTALTTIYEMLAHHTACKNQCYLVLRDVSKAFDKVWHEGLQSEIIKLNLPECIPKFLKNFIKHRQAKIKIGNYIGPAFPLMAGVLQGSVLSSTLYNIHS